MAVNNFRQHFLQNPDHWALVEIATMSNAELQAKKDAFKATMDNLPEGDKKNAMMNLWLNIKEDIEV